jgi:hypothetical protein
MTQKRRDGGVLLRLALIVVYYLVVTPIALVRRAMGGNHLRYKTGELGYWQRRPARSNTAAAMEGPS